MSAGTTNQDAEITQRIAGGVRAGTIRTQTIQWGMEAALDPIGTVAFAPLNWTHNQAPS